MTPTTARGGTKFAPRVRQRLRRISWDGAPGNVAKSLPESQNLRGGPPACCLLVVVNQILARLLEMVLGPRDETPSSLFWSAKESGGYGDLKPSANLAAICMARARALQSFRQEAYGIDLSEAHRGGEVPIGWMFPGWLDRSDVVSRGVVEILCRLPCAGLRLRSGVNHIAKEGKQEACAR